MPSNTPFPLLPPKSTELRLGHFDEDVYVADASTVLYKFMDAMCGDSGAGSLKKEIFIQRLSGALDSIYGSDLDYIFGNMKFLSRTTEESYPHNSMTDMLTSDQWDEVAVKDQWYRNRISEFFIACALGGTANGLRQAVHAATSVDCEILENWRYTDDFGLGSNVGRAPVSSRSEVTIVPHKNALAPKEFRLLGQMLDRISPMDSIVTINTSGLVIASPITVRAAVCDSSYFEVQKTVLPTPILSSLPSPKALVSDMNPSELWLLNAGGVAAIAPTAQFNITQEYGYHYLVSGGQRSPIDSVSYGTLRSDGTVKPEIPFETFETTGEYTAWSEYERVDAPDNHPGGKFGLHPDTAPAVNPDNSAYQFPYPSQQAYVDQRKAEVIAMGGIADDVRYRLAAQAPDAAKRTYTADLAIGYSPPTRDSTITSSWTGRKPVQAKGELRDPSAFIRA